MMEALQKQEKKFAVVSAWLRHILHLCAVGCLALAAGSASAQENAIESISSTQQGASLDLMVGIDKAHAQPLGQGPADRSLAGAHQADEENILMH